MSMDRPLKIVHLITELNVGGAETMLHKLATSSDRSRFEHIIISLTNIGPIGQSLQASGLTVRALGIDRQRSRSLVTAVIRLRGQLRHIAPDVIQTWLYHADLLGILVGTVARIPVIWNIRSTYHPGLASLTSRVCKRLSPLPAAVIVNSEAGRTVYTDYGYRPRRWEVIANGFDMGRFAPDAEARIAVRNELGLPDDALIIGMVARFDPLKDFPTFLQAIALFHRRNPDAYFLAIGHNVGEENADLWGSLGSVGLRGVVRLLGERRDIPRLTAAFDIATLSSHSEGFPNAIGEAMSCGVPCAVTAAGDAARIVGDTGLVVPVRDAQALAGAWQALADLGHAGRVALGGRARARIAQHFSVERVVRQYEELYLQIGARRDRPIRRSEGAQQQGAGALMENRDDATVAGFGEEWTAYDQSSLSRAEADEIFNQYFGLFPWEALPAGATGFDLGCGSGRWAKLVAPRVGRLHCIDASEAALAVARRQLAPLGEARCAFHLASVERIPLPDGSMDFGYSLGVLHHVPDTAAGIRSCVAKLKPGAPFLLYLYYAFDNRPRWFRALWRGSDLLRRIIARLPFPARYALSNLIAAGVYLPLARLARLAARLGREVDGLPLSFYRDRSFYTMRTDALDRFGTRLERRFTASEIRRMMAEAGLERIAFSPYPPHWCALGYKRG